MMKIDRKIEFIDKLNLRTEVEKPNLRRTKKQGN